MSIGSASASLSLDEAIGACSELGRVLGAASSFAVSGWTREHIDNAFGWAEHVEGIMNQMVPDALAPELDKALDAMQKHAAEQERAQGSAQPMVPRVQLVLTVAKLQSARTLLLGLLLQNHAAPHDVARAALARALSWHGGVEATADALLPDVQLCAQLSLLRRMHSHIAAEQHDAPTGYPAPWSPSAPASGTAGAVEGVHGGGGPPAVVAAKVAAAALLATNPYEATNPLAARHTPVALVALAQVLHKREAEPMRGATLHTALHLVHAAVKAPGEELSTLWREPPALISAVCAAEAMAMEDERAAAAHRAADPVVGAPPDGGGILLRAYCCHLHDEMRRVLAADGDEDLDAQWAAWAARWAALLEQREPVRGHAEASLRDEIARLPRETLQTRLRYLAQRAQGDGGTRMHVLH